ncbi:3-deoxy-8-phosphooctulonate synthase [Komagataeibacter intermedius]|uniref:2-dehydro-3-deoxyphosphooctonate aldolase n=2 Tax=Komagataeibacter intermedius TaxID=66229 RepID=A0A0N1FC40_9PROT|nr:3-deoxy-8-phosphooctulonate synthase [Komagataeibacter intermedius]KPH87767.1 2-dehydro-3-deoxyphosphooctonate aldolase [Komagataeibacter intermedius AF2]MCF3635980.1 3-deoxy-8-phosphooctulonate synthase [Komagataeibacter intermedius]GAN88547.1 3-deoxy-8-phosphooctulonate synthase [Komagataeibacter intermedius TF2]GBQ70778.1 3-deoxy-8-phosphooctulonate synthase [Komagataeibacter intermedius NRIC 0521]
MTDHRAVAIGDLSISNESPFVLIAGPCQIESLQQASEVADALHGIAAKLGIGLIYKSSFDKANRTSINGARGVGMAQGLDILSQVRARFGMPVLTDVHQPDQCAPVAEVADVLQIPAFLCRQTDLLLAAGQTGAAVNIKKGQFLAPWDMANVAAKIASTGNDRIMLCERGTSFGYNTLVNDMRALPIMAGTGYPVIYDATHSVQQPGGLGSASGGQRVFAPILARAALAIGVAGVFIETHPDPDTAPSDGATMLPLACMEDLLSSLQQYDRLTKQSPPDVII